MGKVIRLSSCIKYGNPETTSLGRAEQHKSKPTDNNEYVKDSGNVIPVDFSQAQLQLLRIKGRKLEESKLVLYKGDISVEIPVIPNIIIVDVRVLVKNQLLEYYFYCPRCGTKVSGTLQIGSSDKPDQFRISWYEIQEKVRSHILKRAEEGDYPKCTESGAER